MRNRSLFVLLFAVVLLATALWLPAQKGKPKPSPPPSPSQPADLDFTWQDGLNLVTAEYGFLRVWNEVISETGPIIELNGDAQPNVGYQRVTLARLKENEPPAIVLARAYNPDPTMQNSSWYIFLQVYKENFKGVWLCTFASGGYLVETYSDHDLASGDITGDGLDEIVLASRHQLAVFKLTENGLEMISSRNLGDKDRISSITVGDLDGEEGAEIVVASNYFPRQYWYRRILVFNTTALNPYGSFDTLSRGTPPFSGSLQVVPSETMPQIWAPVTLRTSDGDQSWLFGWKWEKGDKPVITEVHQQWLGAFPSWRLGAGQVGETAVLVGAASNAGSLLVLDPTTTDQLGQLETLAAGENWETSVYLYDLLVGPDGGIYLSGNLYGGGFYLGVLDLADDQIAIRWQRAVAGEPRVFQTAIYCTDCE
jgi:hypothetical protein